MLIVVFLQIVGKDISVHESPAALAEDVQTLPEELDLDPGHVVLLHLLHLVLHHRVQLVLKLQGLKVVHIPAKYGTHVICENIFVSLSSSCFVVFIRILPVAVKKISLKVRPALFLVVTVGLRLVLVIPAEIQTFI